MSINEFCTHEVHREHYKGSTIVVVRIDDRIPRTRRMLSRFVLYVGGVRYTEREFYRLLPAVDFGRTLVRTTRAVHSFDRTINRMLRQLGTN